VGTITITAAYQGEPTHAQSRGEFSLDVKPSNSFRLSKPRLHKRRGTATLVAKLPGAGKLVLKGRRIHRRVKEPTDAGKRKLGVKPTGKKRRKLRRCGTASVKAKVTYTPTGGGPRTKTRLFALRLRRR
jgi:hypothetical protein